MTNIPNKLDQKIKESLGNYTEPYSESGWERLSKELDARGGNSGMKWQWKYSMNTIIGASILGGVILLTAILTTSGNDVSANVPSSSMTEKKETGTYKPRSSKSISTLENNVLTANMLLESSVFGSAGQVQPSTAPQNSDATNTMMYAQYYGSAPAPKSPIVQIKPNSSGDIVNPLIRGNPFVMQDQYNDLSSNLPKIDDRNNGKGMKLSPEELKIFTNNQLLSQKGVIFGDQIDPRKGYIHPTKETDSMQRLMQYWNKLSDESEQTTLPDSLNTKTLPDLNSPVPDTDQPKEKKKKAKKSKGEKVKETKNSGDDGNNTSKDDEQIKRRPDKPKDDHRKDPLNPYR